MLNSSYVGRSLPATKPQTVTTESVAAFSAALGFSAPTIVPPTYLISLTLPASDSLIEDPEFGLDFSRVLHREQRFSYHRPVSVGQVLSCTVTVESIKVVAGNELVTLRTEVAEADVSGTESSIASVWTTLFVASDEAMKGQ